MAAWRQGRSWDVPESACRCCARRTHLADALLEFVVARAPERERMVRDARVALATAGLHRAVVREALDGRLAHEREGFPELRSELAAIQDRVVEGAELLLGLRAVASTIGFVA